MCDYPTDEELVPEDVVIVPKDADLANHPGYQEIPE